MKDFYALIKIGYQFYSTENFAEEQRKLSPTFMTLTQPLDDDQIQHKSFNVVPKSVQFMNWWVYSDQIVKDYD